MESRGPSRYSDGLGDGSPGFDSRRRQEFSLFHGVQTDSGAHPTSYSMVTGELSTGTDRPGREAYHSPPSGAKVKNGGAIPPFLHVFMT
jgi:hypothetical protein